MRSGLFRYSAQNMPGFNVFPTSPSRQDLKRSRGIKIAHYPVVHMLSDIIIQKIKQEGPLSFHDFMEMALYHPGSGYYTSQPEKIGSNGDFYTSSSLTSAFGAMIARQLEQMWNILGKDDFTIVEYGAGTGQLCQDILDYCKDNKEFYDHLTYCIIEKSPSLCEQQQLHLPGEKVRWQGSIGEIAPVRGCILSNELIDNFSVHLVVMEEKLMEIFVDYTNDFTEVLNLKQNHEPPGIWGDD